MLGSQAIAQILRIEGVQQVFCFPFTPIMEALAEAEIRPVVARQERVAENMADGFSRNRGEPENGPGAWLAAEGEAYL